jgi:hypothetical protein
MLKIEYTVKLPDLSRVDNKQMSFVINEALSEYLANQHNIYTFDSTTVITECGVKVAVKKPILQRPTKKVAQMRDKNGKFLPKSKQGSKKCSPKKR